MTRRQRVQLAGFSWKWGTRTLGAVGFLHEVVITKGERPTLLLICVAMMGVSLFTERDKQERDDEQ